VSERGRTQQLFNLASLASIPRQAGGGRAARSAAGGSGRGPRRPRDQSLDQRTWTTIEEVERSSRTVQPKPVRARADGRGGEGGRAGEERL